MNRLKRLVPFALSMAIASQGMLATSGYAFGDQGAGRDGNWKSDAQGSPSLGACQKRVKENPKDAVAQNDLGWAYRQNGDLKSAEASLREAINLDPNLAQAHSNLSVVLLDQGNKDEALLQAQKAVGLNDKQPIFEVVLGNALCAKGDYKSAIKEYKAALAIRTDYENAFFHLGEAYYKDGQLTEAKVTLGQALVLNKTDNRVWALLDKITQTDSSMPATNGPGDAKVETK